MHAGHMNLKLDEAYVINAILNPNLEKTIEYKDAVMANPGLDMKGAKDMLNYIKSLK